MDKATQKEINQAVIEALRKEKSGYLNIKTLITGLPTRIKISLGYKSSIKSKEFSAKDALSRLDPFLEKTVQVYLKGNLVYLSFDTKKNMVLKKLRQAKSIQTFKLLRKNVLPLLKEDFTQALNSLLLSGEVRCTFKGDNPILQTSDQLLTPSAEPIDLKKDKADIYEISGNNDLELFHSALNFIGKGRRMVYIYMVRRRLNWSRERFDKLIRTLRAEYKIQLHGGDPSVMAEDEVRDSFMDERGILHISLSWRG